ncbi:MAG: hypothetical protein BAJALOKI3v1_390004 [Promethearchaeota archaeon]|nr:MAG: hypothetical protein BAJALOKI3v1_390004 [Candidatus Lokiarchaeota archaeon]
MSKEKRIEHLEECECDKPEIRATFKQGCSKEQIIKCHGKKYLESLEG